MRRPLGWGLVVTVTENRLCFICLLTQNENRHLES